MCVIQYSLQQKTKCDENEGNALKCIAKFYLYAQVFPVEYMVAFRPKHKLINLNIDILTVSQLWRHNLEITLFQQC